jgi:tRNA modification GTPase
LALQAVVRAGARPANPGEFTQRAFLNGRLDLTQAEAVNDLIHAQTHAALHVANAQYSGALAQTVEGLWESCRTILAELEVRLDFPEEDATPTADTGALLEQLDRLLEQLATVSASRLEGEVLREGVSVVIAGPPNAGKSTLLNAILGRDRAIVSDIPGTTRDTLEELAHIRDIPVRITDTAGLRAAVETVEALGVERSHSALRSAHIVLWLHDAGNPRDRPGAPEDLTRHARVIEVLNKADLCPAGAAAATGRAGEDTTPIPISASRGEGLDALYDAVEEAVWSVPHHSVPDVAVSERHAHLLDRARDEIETARGALEEGLAEVAASASRGALASLGRITGREVTSEDILGDIFSKFCMGK